MSFINFFLLVLGRAGSPWLLEDFLQLQRGGLLASCGVPASHCGGFFCCRMRALGTQVPGAVAHELSCSTSCGIFLDQGSNPCLLHWQVGSLPLDL